MNLEEEVILPLLLQSGTSDSATMFCYMFKYLLLTVARECERERERGVSF